MTREEQLNYCKVCKNKGFDKQQGIICNLTGSKADFQYECLSYQEDVELKKKEEQVGKKSKVIRKMVSPSKRFANLILDQIFLMIFSVFMAITFSLGGYFFSIVVIFIYYTVFEALTGKSIAKYITNTKVVDVNGEKPVFSVIAVRSLCRFIPFEALSFLGSNNSGWHDTISKTYVIEED